MFQDTIAAIATAAGEGGIAVIRVSGSRSAEVVGAVFTPRSSGNVNLFRGYTVHYGVIRSQPDGETIDDAILTVFRAPRSYTGEDVCEIACHGGSTTTRVVLDLLLRAGARIALPGEFTQRAFLNGRIDLAQAEAVAELVKARTESARKLARRQLAGDISVAAAAVRDDLIGIVAAIEVTIDFSDEVGDLDYVELRERLNRSVLDVRRLIASADKGRVLREGLNVVIVGRPNVGKSSLLNALLRNERAIVTPIPGTTRDTIEENLAICGVAVVLTDTAGLRETDDAIERIGVERSREAILNADVALLVLDASAGITSEDIASERYIRGDGNGNETDTISKCKCIVVWNKSDLVDEQTLELLIAETPTPLKCCQSFSVSAISGSGVDLLEQALAAPYIPNVDPTQTSFSDPITSVVVSNARHTHALMAAEVSLSHARHSANAEMPGDFIALDVRGALDALGWITGETVTEDIIHRVFQDFCVGK